jgi:hypothetical protein
MINAILNRRINMQKILSIVASFFVSIPVFAGVVYIKEPAGSVRFEQYAGVGGSLVLWRMPSPGTSLFPGTTCLNVAIQATEKEKSSRFMAFYLFAKSSGDQIFYYINTDNCQMISFGIDG